MQKTYFTKIHMKIQNFGLMIQLVHKLTFQVRFEIEIGKH